MKRGYLGILIFFLVVLTNINAFGFSTGLRFNQHSDSTKSIYRQHFMIPSITVGLGIYSRFQNVPFNKQYFYNIRQNHFPTFHSKIDDYIHYTPMAAAFGLQLAGLPGENDFINKTILITKAQLLMFALVYPVKSLIGDLRPDGSEYNSFPSGHTTHAFVAAQFLYKEYGKDYPMIGIAGYAIAIGTGIMRMLNNRHWSADVFAGAGLGILCVNLAYLTHQYRFGKSGLPRGGKLPI